MIKKSISLTKVFEQNSTKELSFGEVRATFPSIGFSLKSHVDLNPFLETERNNTISNISIVSIPISSSKTLKNQLNTKLTKDDVFYKTHPLMVDFETEYWYKSDHATLKRKKAYETISGKPVGWDGLFTIPPPSEANRRNYSISSTEYNNKLRDFFGNESRSVRLVTSCMNHAYKELNASLVLPPAPLIIDAGVSTEKSLYVNQLFNQYRGTLDLFKAAYYNLHPNVLKFRSVHQKILNQIYELNPEVVIISAIDSEKYLFPKNHYNDKKPNFDTFMNELATYAKTTNAVVLWYDKGRYSSSYGFKLIQKGIDGFIYPVRGHSQESPGGTLMYGSVLDEFTYNTWKYYLSKMKKWIPCERDCCKRLSPEELRSMTEHQQWHHKRIHEVIVRNSQMNHLLEKLHAEGTLRDFSVRLKQNFIN